MRANTLFFAAGPMAAMLLASGGLLGAGVLMQSGQPEDDAKKSCHEMAGKHEEMMSRMHEADRRLQDLVREMNAATGDERVDAIVEIINELASQRAGMQERMQGMHADMMQHMSEHMGASMPEEERQAMRDSMESCPMMEEMKDAAKGGHRAAGD